MEHFCGFTKFSSLKLYIMAPKINIMHQVLMLTAVARFDKWVEVNKHRKLRRRELCEILYFKKRTTFNFSPCGPCARYCLLIGSQLTTWSQRNLHYIRLRVMNYGLHLFQLNGQFFCLLQPSLARLYSVAASLSFVSLSRRKHDSRWRIMTLRRTQNLNLWFQPENLRFEVCDCNSRTSWHAQWLSCSKNISDWRP